MNGIPSKNASDVLRHMVGGELAEGRFSRRQSGICHWFVFTSRTLLVQDNENPVNIM